jgi:hypothetical protein
MSNNIANHGPKRPLHPIFRDAPEPQAILWRYLSFARFVSLLHSERLHFKRIDRFDDHFEGAWPQNDVDFWKDEKLSVTSMSCPLPMICDATPQHRAGSNRHMSRLPCGACMRLEKKAWLSQRRLASCLTSLTPLTT